MERRLFESISASDKKSTLHRRLLAGSAAVLLIGGSAAAWATQTVPTTVSATEARPVTAYCYATASTSSHYQQVDVSAASQGATGRPRQQKSSFDPSALATQRCASLWTDGALGQEQNGAVADTGSKDPEPSLQACVRRDQAIAVFPRAPGNQTPAKEFCVGFGMAAPAGS